MMTNWIIYFQSFVSGSNRPSCSHVIRNIFFQKKLRGVESTSEINKDDYVIFVHILIINCLRTLFRTCASFAAVFCLVLSQFSAAGQSSLYFFRNHKAGADIEFGGAFPLGPDFKK